MPVSRILFNTNLYQTSSPQTRVGKLQDNFQQLEQALQSGNLSGAQQAFAALQQLMPNLSASNQTQNGQINSSQSLFRTGLNAIGQALKSGDLSAAKAAFTKLQQDIQSFNKGHKGHHHLHNVDGSKNFMPSSKGNSSLTNTSNINSKSVGSNINLTA